MSLYKEYISRMQKIADVNYSIAVLSWDQEVNMPSKGAQYRGQQIATLSGMSHEMLVDEKIGDLLKKLREDNSLDEIEKKNVEESWRDYERKKKLPTDFVIELSNAVSRAYHAWIKARREDDFKQYQSELENMVRLKRKEADYIGFEDHPYDALLDEYEPDEKTANLVPLFEDVKTQLLPLLNAIKEEQPIDDGFMYERYDKDKQWHYGLVLLKQMGYDFEAGRQDISEHPFTTTFSPLDVRVTTRIDEKDLKNMMWSCIHEGGHALYEQGLNPEYYGLPAGEAISLGIHESQSRLWENNVGRSLAYWKFNYSKLQQTFPEQLGSVSLDDFYKAMNLVKPSLIRTESDELTYHFHILIRFEIEKALIEGSLEVKDVKEAWNAKYKEYLDIDVPTDKEGVLQDIHWSHGSFGYFPTYSLGSFYAAQFYNQATKDINGLESQTEEGHLKPLLDWLRENIHQHGRLFKAGELCEKVTGEPLNFKHFMAYAERKFEGIYGLVAK